MERNEERIRQRKGEQEGGDKGTEEEEGGGEGEREETPQKQ